MDGSVGDIPGTVLRNLWVFNQCVVTNTTADQNRVRCANSQVNPQRMGVSLTEHWPTVIELLIPAELHHGGRKLRSMLASISLVAGGTA
jgi:hypothetical protein